MTIPQPRFLTFVVALALIPLALSAQAPAPGTQDQPATSSSPIDGNWLLTGSRERNEFPILSLRLHVEGTHLVGVGEQSFRCLDDARTGAGGSLGLTGEIAPDASFTLLTPSSRNTLQVTVTGKMPDVGASTWKGTYRLTGLTRPNCNLNQEGSFTAQPLPALTGRFSGPITMSYYEAPATAYKGPTYAHLSFTVNYAQGKLLIHSRRLGASIAYLPLAAEIHVKGSPCFAHGSTVAGDLYNAIAGNMATVRFTMDDGSELSLNTVYTSPTGGELLIQIGGVHGGLCDHQLFAGTLTNH